MSEVAEGFEPVAQSVGAARRLAVDRVRVLGAADLEEDVRTVVSELATNAVLHARTRFAVTIDVDEGAVRVAVHDGSSTPPRANRLRDPSASTGRGLLMVAELSRTWGVEPDPDGRGKTVWCELPLARPAADDLPEDDLEALLARYDDPGAGQAP